MPQTVIHEEFDYDVSIADIKKYFRTNHTGPYFSMFETGLDNNRFDLIRVNPYSQHIRIYEFKSCRRDFISDKKWQNYLEYCHTFTFVCPRDAIKRDDLPRYVGLMYIYKWRWHHETRLDDTWILEQEWIKRPKKREMEKSMVSRIAFMLIHRTKWRKEDVF